MVVLGGGAVSYEQCTPVQGIVFDGTVLGEVPLQGGCCCLHLLPTILLVLLVFTII